MGLGRLVRARLGRWEAPAIRLYRSAFIDIDTLGTILAGVTQPRRILEIGAGDGAVGAVLTHTYPAARYLGIDISTQPGRMYDGDPDRAEFRTMTSDALVAEQPEPFDLVLLVDVIHHVAEDLRAQVLQDAVALTAPGGLLAVKEWERGRGLSHAIAYTADRYVSGDRTVRFHTGPELRAMVDLPGFELVHQSRIPPRGNNLLLVLQRA